MPTSKAVKAGAVAATTPLTPKLMQKKVDDYFACVLSFERQRDMWRDMYNDANRTHMNAQRVLEAELEAARARLLRAIALVNEYCTRLGEPVLLPPTTHLPGAPPVGEVQRTMAAIAELDKRAPKLQAARKALRALQRKHDRSKRQ